MKHSPINLEMIFVYGLVGLAVWLMMFRPVPVAGLTAAAPTLGNQPTASTVVHYTDRIAILTYHNLAPAEGPGTISPDSFTEQMDYLVAQGYNFIGLPQLQEFMKGGTVPPNAVLITFDDGYRSVYQSAYPILQSKHLPAAVFLIVSKIGQSTNQIPKLTWEEISAMQASGIVFGSHTYDSHHEITGPDGQAGPALTTPQYLASLGRYETDQEYQARIQKDLALAKSTLEARLGIVADSLCLPYGISNPVVQAVSKNTGYHFIFTVNEGLVQKQSDPFAIKRINAGQIGMNGADVHLRITSLLK